MRRTALGILLLLLASGVSVLTYDFRHVEASESMPDTCELPRWLIAFIFIIAVLVIGNFIIFLLWWLKRNGE